MAMTYFRKMTKRQASAALAEYLAERPVALQRLRGELAADDQDPDTLLDGTPGSLTPLWRWVATRIMTMEDNDIPFDPDAPAPAWWPSWARYSSDLPRTTPDEVVPLLDGFISYLGDVVTTAAPEAVWQVGQPGIASAYREDREVVLVTAPDWDAERLERWVLDWLKGRLPELN